MHALVGLFSSLLDHIVVVSSGCSVNCDPVFLFVEVVVLVRSGASRLFLLVPETEVEGIALRLVGER